MTGVKLKIIFISAFIFIIIGLMFVYNTVLKADVENARMLTKEEIIARIKPANDFKTEVNPNTVSARSSFSTLDSAGELTVEKISEIFCEGEEFVRPAVSRSTQQVLDNNEIFIGESENYKMNANLKHRDIQIRKKIIEDLDDGGDAEKECLKFPEIKNRGMDDDYYMNDSMQMINQMGINSAEFLSPQILTTVSKTIEKPAGYFDWKTIRDNESAEEVEVDKFLDLARQLEGVEVVGSDIHITYLVDGTFHKMNYSWPIISEMSVLKTNLSVDEIIDITADEIFSRSMSIVNDTDIYLKNLIIPEFDGNNDIVHRLTAEAQITVPGPEGEWRVASVSINITNIGGK